MTRTPWLQTTGGIVAILLLTQVCTGVLLAFYYVPSVDHAYTTVSYIEKVVSSGSWLRALHHYGSQWLSVFVFVHVIRLFWSGAYNTNRIQWIVGILILGLVMAAGGTGYSLPWDARAFFSTRVAEGLWRVFHWLEVSRASGYSAAARSRLSRSRDSSRFTCSLCRR